MHVSRHFAAWTVLFVIFGAAFVFAQGNDIGIGVDSSILRDIDNWNRSCYPKDTCELGVVNLDLHDNVLEKKIIVLLMTVFFCR